jgi:cytochrome c-type biogenesis protein CcmH/NrfG
MIADDDEKVRYSYAGYAYAPRCMRQQAWFPNLSKRRDRSAGWVTSRSIPIGNCFFEFLLSFLLVAASARCGLYLYSTGNYRQVRLGYLALDY